MTGMIEQGLELNLALAAAILAVGLGRAPLRRMFGARAAYTAWVAVPLAALASFLPQLGANLPLTPLPAEGSIAALSHSASEAIPELAPGVFAVWLAGALAMGAVLGWRQASYLSWLGQLTPVAGDERRFTAKRPGIGPAAIGLLTPRIITGGDFEEAFQPEERALILEHEQVHLRRGDVPVNALAAAARCAFWFNPLIHWAAHTIRIDQELACDAAVLERFPGKRRAYAELLLKTQLSTRPVPIGCHWPARPGHLLKERIVMLKSPIGTTARTTAGLGAASLFALVIAGGAWAAEQQANVAGSWSFVGDIKAGKREALAKPQCIFKQSGGQLSGTCKGPNSVGPATGKVEGQHVSWRWEHKPYTGAGLGGVSSFNGAIGSDQVIHGAWSYSGLPGAQGSFSGQRQ